MRNIEIRIGLDDAYGRAVTRGIIRYAKERGDWKLYGAVRRDFLSFGGDAGPDGAERTPDGIITRIESPQAAQELASRGIPVADVAGAFPSTQVLQGEAEDALKGSTFFYEANNDDFITGRRAGEYLRRLGFKRFAFFGVHAVVWSNRRKAGFQEAVGVHPKGLETFERPLEWWKDPELEEQELRKRLGALSRPTAVFACNDIAGLKVAEACRRSGITVPEEIAILGVDDEDLICELADPSLSSVRLDGEGIGRAAAELLDQAMGGELGEKKRLVAPRDIIERESTRTMVANDEAASRALSWIRSHAVRGAKAGDLAAIFPGSRRTLEKRFKGAWGKTIHQAFVEVRLERAKVMLAESDFTLDEVAERSGFGTLQRFRIAFKEQEGITPGAWRKAGRRS